MNTSNNEKENRIIWVDVETTGLDCNRDLLLQVAVVITDENLVPIHEGIEVTISQPAEDIDSLMNDYVTQMHTDSGLLANVISSKKSTDVDVATELLLYYLEEHTIAGSSPMAGSTVSFDRGFLKVDMPTLERHFHYRNIDVSTIKELARRWNPEVYSCAPPKMLAHTALSDIKESIAELRHYRSKDFIGQEKHTPRG